MIKTTIAIMLLLSMTILIGCSSKPQVVQVKCPACGYEHEVEVK